MTHAAHLLAALLLSLAPATAQDAAPATPEEAQEPGEREAPREPVPAEAAVDEAIERGVEILLERQETLADGEDRSGERKTTEDAGEWPYEGVYRVRGRIPIGYRIGGTSICARALLEVSGFREDKERQRAVRKALDFVLEALDEKLMESGFKGTYDVRGWGHAYALDFLLRLRQLGHVDRTQKAVVDDKITWLIRTLEETEIPEEGGWNYSRRAGAEKPAAPSPFMTAATLQALMQATVVGEQVDAEVIERGLDALERGRTESSSYQYAVRRGRGQSREAVEGAIARMAICETTLLLGHRGDLERLEGAVQAFFEHWGWLEVRRRQTGTHIPPFGVAPYYYFFGHGYVAQAIEMLPEEKRAPYRARLQATLFSIREDSGGWNDRVFDRSENYGTAMSLLALTAPRQGAPEKWYRAASETASRED